MTTSPKKCESLFEFSVFSTMDDAGYRYDKGPELGRMALLHTVYARYMNNKCFYRDYRPGLNLSRIELVNNILTQKI